MGESVSLPFPASRDHPHSWAGGPFLHLQSQQHSIFKLSSLSLPRLFFASTFPLLTLISCLPLIKIILDPRR